MTAIALQNDGKIVLAGHFDNFDGVSRASIARLNQIDSTNRVVFNLGPQPWEYSVNERWLQPQLRGAFEFRSFVRSDL